MKKVPSAFYTFGVLIKNLVKRYRVYFYYFLDSLKLDYEKRTHYGVIFKLFSVSLKNTKILPSKLVTFTLVKVLERSTSRW